jgi:hypothetical protein
LIARAFAIAVHDVTVAEYRAAEYGEVVNALRTVLSARLGPRELEKVFRRNAEQFYGLEKLQ